MARGHASTARQWLPRTRRWTVGALRELSARSLAPLVAVLVTGTAGAYMPGAPTAEPAVPAPAHSWQRDPAPTPNTRDFETLLGELDGQERRIRAEVETMEPRLDIVRRRMVARGRAYYRLVRAGLLPVGGGFDELVDHATRVERLRAALQRDLAEQQRIQQRRKKLDRELRRVRAERAPLEVHRQAMTRAEAAMRQADERREAFERAFRQSQPPPGHLAVYGAGTGPTDSAPLDGFEAMRGRLSFPLAGRAEVPTPDDPRSGNGPGLSLRAVRNTAVRSIYPGRVVFVGQYLDYGQTVLLDHGDSYFSLYGRLSRTEVKLGDSVPDRGRLGWVSRQGSRRPTLYFELRKGTAPIEAASWLGI